ncbi:MAG: DUF4911 domain-containing protein [Clostridia bacterium]|jgi:hypothetical protein|nr:DUF4911 domain-containing protein [Clostridia bacterium]MDD4571697.1 DUF4911 domain-containing protein [Clostridia bacterium]
MEIDNKYASEHIYVQVKPADIDIFNKFIEAYDNMALVTTVNASSGELVLWVTPDTRSTVLKLITKLPCKVKLLKT